MRYYHDTYAHGYLIINSKCNKKEFILLLYPEAVSCWVSVIIPLHNSLANKYKQVADTPLMSNDPYICVALLIANHNIEQHYIHPT